MKQSYSRGCPTPAWADPLGGRVAARDRGPSVFFHLAADRRKRHVKRILAELKKNEEGQEKS